MKLADFIPPIFRRGARIEPQPHVITYGPPNPAIMAQYEAARHSLDRSWLPGYVADARTDIDSGQRLELIRKSRYFEKNNGHYQKILDLIETNVVGNGITPTPGSSSAEFNRIALKWWRKWCKVADLTSRQTMEACEAIIARGQAVDGEMFVYLTFSDSGRPRIQLIETHRIVSAHLPTYKAEGYRDVDGILIDARGRPAFYVVGQDADVFSASRPGTVAVIPASQIIHVFEPSRAGQYHGIPIAHAVLHDMHDLDDLQKYEMLAAKDEAENAKVVYTENGELPDSMSPVGKSLQRTGATPITDQDRQTYYSAAFGGKTVALRRGDRVERNETKRPSVATQGFWESLENKICKGIGISYAAVCDYAGKWGGAALRGVVIADNRFYDVRTTAIASCMQRIWEHAIGWAIENNQLFDDNGQLLTAIPLDWREVEWQPPQRATVDIGYDSAATINDLRAGLTTRRKVLGEKGQDWRKVVDQIADEEAYIDQKAVEKNIDRQRISSLDPNERAAAAQPEPAPAERKLAA